MSDVQREARERAHQKIAEIQATVQRLQGDVVQAAYDLNEAGLNGERIMTETGMQLISVSEAVGLAKSAA